MHNTTIKQQISTTKWSNLLWPSRVQIVSQRTIVESLPTWLTHPAPGRRAAVSESLIHPPQSQVLQHQAVHLGQVSLQVLAHAEYVAADMTRRLTPVHLLMFAQSVRVGVALATNVTGAQPACQIRSAVSLLVQIKWAVSLLVNIIPLLMECMPALASCATTCLSQTTEYGQE